MSGEERQRIQWALVSERSCVDVTTHHPHYTQHPTFQDDLEKAT